MKKTYQIEAQRAMSRLEEMAATGNPVVQMVLPMAEMVGYLREGVGELVRRAGLQLLELMMEAEVQELVGERSRPQAERKANRWGQEQGYCVMMGQKVPLQRPRVRTTDDREVRLGTYETFHRGEPLTEAVWRKLMLGLTTRNYGQAVREFSEAYWDLDQKSPISVPGYDLRGVMKFVDKDRRSPFNGDYNNFSPRIGFAYALNSKTTMRGG